MIYSDLIINKKNWDQLVRAQQFNKLSHAFLFHGPAGCGKEGHALELAAFLNCSNRANYESCGICPSCKKTKTFQNQNIKFIIPLPRGNIKTRSDSVDKAFSGATLKEYLEQLKNKEKDPYYSINLKSANTILINSIRDIKHDLSLSTINNEWRIILIFQAEKLCIPSPESAHSLLKILEEPPEKTIFILVSSQSDAILDTIKSRCQNLYYPPISQSILENRLIESGADSIEAAVVSRISYGNIKLSRELLDNSTDLIKMMFLLLNACFSSNSLIWNKCIDNLSRLKIKNINQLKHLFNMAIIFIRDILYYSKTLSDKEIIFKNEKQKIEKIIKLYPNADWYSCIYHFEDSLNYIFRNGYLPLQIICMIFDIQKSLRGEFNETFKLSDWIQV